MVRLLVNTMLRMRWLKQQQTRKRSGSLRKQKSQQQFMLKNAKVIASFCLNQTDLSLSTVSRTRKFSFYRRKRHLNGSSFRWLATRELSYQIKHSLVLKIWLLVWVQDRRAIGKREEQELQTQNNTLESILVLTRRTPDSTSMRLSTVWVLNSTYRDQASTNNSHNDQNQLEWTERADQPLFLVHKKSGSRQSATKEPRWMSDLVATRAFKIPW
jgi:hypothetical protein